MEQISIFSFLLIHPHFLANRQLPQKSRGKILKALHSIDRPYQLIPEPQKLFSRIRNLNDQALRTLVATGPVQINEDDRLEIREDVIEDFRDNEAIISFQARKSYHFVIIDNLSDLPVFGLGGLKDRTGLMEFRYDRAS